MAIALPDNFWNNFIADEPASSTDITAVEEEFRIKLPEEYKTFLLRSNGGEGTIGKRAVILWQIQDLKQFNLDYDASTHIPGLLLFGSNGGGEGYAFDTRTMPLQIVQVPFVGMSLDHAVPVARTFNDFLTLPTLEKLGTPMSFPGMYPDKEGKDFRWLLCVPLFLLVIGLILLVGSDNPLFPKPKKPAPIPGEPAAPRR